MICFLIVLLLLNNDTKGHLKVPLNQCFSTGVHGVQLNGSMRPDEEVHILSLEFDKVFFYNLFAHACIFVVNSRVILQWRLSL